VKGCVCGYGLLKGGVWGTIPLFILEVKRLRRMGWERETWQ